MNICPLYVPVETAEKVNCGTCRHWDPERQRCQEEEKLKSYPCINGRKGDEKHDESYHYSSY